MAIAPSTIAEGRPDGTLPLVRLSFAIPAHDEETQLPETLLAIHAAAQECGLALDRDYEVVVADDASTDGTARVAAAHGARVVHHDARQIAASRNAAARAARGDWIVFVDADTRVNAEAVGATLIAFEAGATGGGCRVRFDEPVPRYADVLLHLMMVGYRLVGLASGAYIFCTREAWSAIGGFDETLYAGEEAIMSAAIRHHGRFVFLNQVAIETSGRKLRAYGMGEIFLELVKLGLGGRRRLRRRDKLDIWYGPRRAQR